MSPRVHEPTSPRKKNRRADTPVRPSAPQGREAHESRSPRKKTSSPARRLSGSPDLKQEGVKPRRKKAPRIGAGATAVIFLKEPREQCLGRLLKIETAGVWVRGIELESLDAWAREVARGESAGLGLHSLFVPFQRVQKIVADERTDPIPSFAERFESIAGRPLSSLLDE